MVRHTVALLSMLAVSLASPALVRAGGFEFSAPGTRALGRAGAFMARADDPMALGYNPAALAFLPSYQLQLGSHLIFYDACVRRTGTYGDSATGDPGFGFSPESRFGTPDTADWPDQAFPEVCRGGGPGPSPQLVFSGHPLPELGFAIGLLAPAAVGSGTWGNADGSIDVGDVNLPSPTRYALVEQNLLLFHPSIGVGWSPVPEFSVGLTLQWGIGIVDFVNHTNAATGAEDPGDDVRTHLNAVDFFVPAFIASVHVVPIDQLDIVAMARISDNIDADGSLALTTGTFGTGQDFSLTPTETVVQGTNLRAGQPWTFGLSVRYADRVTPRYRDPERAGRVTGRIEDPMQNETFDLELDLVYTFNGPVGDFVVTQPDGASARVCDGGAGGACLDAPLPTTLPLPHGWNDQFTVRLGGDWNVVPGAVAVRAGAHFETSGVNSTYQTQDVLPGMRLGLHLGATFRIERFDISIAYAHIFQFDETVSDGNYRLIAAQGTMGQCEGDPAYDPERPVSSRGCFPAGAGTVVNNGTYTGEFNVISASVRYHFE